MSDTGIFMSADEQEYLTSQYSGDVWRLAITKINNAHSKFADIIFRHMLRYAVQDETIKAGTRRHAQWHLERNEHVSFGVFRGWLRPEVYQTGCVSDKLRADIIREIVGNPFQPARLCKDEKFDCSFCSGTGESFKVDAILADGSSVNPRPAECMCCQGTGKLCHDEVSPCDACQAFITPTVASMAQAIVERGCYEEMPILADALEEAGCDNEEILQHCRQQMLQPKSRQCKCGGEFRPLKKDLLPLLSQCNKCRTDGPFWKSFDELGLYPKPVPCLPGCWVLRLILGDSAVPVPDQPRASVRVTRSE